MNQVASEIILLFGVGERWLFIESKHREIAWRTRISINELPEIEVLDGTGRKTYVGEVQGGELVVQLLFSVSLARRIEKLEAGLGELSIDLQFTRCRAIH